MRSLLARPLTPNKSSLLGQFLAKYCLAFQKKRNEGWKNFMPGPVWKHSAFCWGSLHIPYCLLNPFSISGQALTYEMHNPILYLSAHVECFTLGFDCCGCHLIKFVPWKFWVTGSPWNVSHVLLYQLQLFWYALDSLYSSILCYIIIYFNLNRSWLLMLPQRNVIT